MVTLTDRQQHDLDKAVYNYLQSRNFSQASAAFKSECNIGDEPPDPKLDGLLEKKWVAVIRLQKKVLELETRMMTLQEELKASPASRNSSAVDWIPKAPPRHSLAGHRSPINRVAFHPVFSIIATASEDASIKIWDWETGELERTLTGHTRDVKDVDFHPQGTYLVSASSDLTIKLWDTSAWDARGYTAQSMHGHDHTISTARFLHNGDFLVSASRDRTIKIWEVATKFCVRTISAHDDWVRYVVPSVDDRLLASCSNDHTARVWEYKTGAMKAELRGHELQVEVAIFAPSNSYQYIRELTGITDSSTDPGQFIVTGGRDKWVMIWDANSGRHLKTFHGHDGWIRGLEFHPSGKFLISVADDKNMRIWDLATGRCTRVLEAHTHFVACIAWGRATVGGGAAPAVNGTNGAQSGQPQKRRINVVATAGVDMLVNIWTP